MATELLTVKDAAARLKVNPQTVRRWIRGGLLPATKVGKRQWRVRAEDVAQPSPSSHPAELARRRAAIDGLRRLRSRLQGRGIVIADIVAESKAELERTRATGGG